MSSTGITVRNFTETKDITEFSGSLCYGFWDWFCKDKNLEKIARSMRVKLRYLVKSQLVDADSTKVWFKNDFDQNNTMVFKDIKNDKNIAHIKIVTTAVSGWQEYKHNRIIVVAYDDDVAGNNSYWVFDDMDWKGFRKKLDEDYTFTKMIGRILRPQHIYVRDIKKVRGE